ncbi:MAG TPA: hydrolase, partial [Alcanivorax sp.]|nr:hydrolase [Alcanivorax sp.]
MAFTHHTTELNGQRYAYLDEGEGPLLVFGHGVLADKSMFEAQIEALRHRYRYRCVSLDWPGHTGSGYREKGWSFYDMADDSVALLDQLGYDQAIFVGLSQGGMTFMRLALKYPERVRALVLLDTSADPEDADLLPVHRQQQSRFAHGSDAERDEVVTRMQKFLYAKPWRDANPDGVAHEKAL